MYHQSPTAYFISSAFSSLFHQLYPELVNSDIFGTMLMIFSSICRLSPGIEELIQKLKAKRKHVYLISGGFRQMINVWIIVVMIIFLDLF